MPDQLNQFAETAIAFATAVEALNEESKNRLRHYLFELKDGGSHDLEHVVSAAQGARRAAKAVEQRPQEQPKPPGPPPGGDEAVIALVQDIAREYRRTFKKPPSAARLGVFARALAAIFEAYDVRDPEDETRLLKIGESRLRSILKHPTE